MSAVRTRVSLLEDTTAALEKRFISRRRWMVGWMPGAAGEWRVIWVLTFCASRAM